MSTIRLPRTTIKLQSNGVVIVHKKTGDTVTIDVKRLDNWAIGKIREAALLKYVSPDRL